MKNIVCVDKCGTYKRTILAFPPENKVVIGCFEGTFAEAEQAILDKYGPEADYLSKLAALKTKWEANEPFNPERFNWKKGSRYVAQHCPDNLDPNKYNWEDDSRYVAQYCPDKLDPNKYNWERDSRYVAECCPDKLDPNKYNWERRSWVVAKYCPDKLDPEKYNWKKDSWAVLQYCPDKIRLRPTG